MSQRERVLARLKQGPTCGTEFLDMRIPRYSARILELRQAGHIIVNRPCQHYYHDHRSGQTMFELATSDQMSLL